MIDARLIDYSDEYREAVVLTDVDFCVHCGSQEIEKRPAKLDEVFVSRVHCKNPECGKSALVQKEGA